MGVSRRMLDVASKEPKRQGDESEKLNWLGNEQRGSGDQREHCLKFKRWRNCGGDNQGSRRVDDSRNLEGGVCQGPVAWEKRMGYANGELGC